MANRRSVNWPNQVRVNTSDMRQIESAVRNDFDDLISSFVAQPGSSHVVRGYRIPFTSAVGSSATGLQLEVANASLFHGGSDFAGTFLVLPESEPNQTLNSTTNPKVDGAFTPNTLNYIGIEFDRKVDDATASQRYFWNPTTNVEFTQFVPLAEVLDYRIVITSSVWDSNVMPIALVETDASNNVVRVDDRRDMLFRLGKGGTATPDPFYVYPWNNDAEGREENFWSSSTNGQSPFVGGDKQIETQKEWMDAIMSELLQIKGTTFWYQPNAGGSLVNIRYDLGNTVMTGSGLIVHDGSNPGRLNWTSDINLTVVGSRVKYSLLENATGGNLTLTDDQVAYIEIGRDIDIIPQLIYIQGSPTVESVGGVSWTTDVQAGDYIKVASENVSKYYEIDSVDSTSQVTLTENFLETSTGPQGIDSQYAIGSYEAVASPSTQRHIQIADRENVPFGENIYWFFLRSDNGGAKAQIFVRSKGTEIEEGESIEISDNTSEEILTFIGSTGENDSAPNYSSTNYVTQGIDLTSGIGELDTQVGTHQTELSNIRTYSGSAGPTDTDPNYSSTNIVTQGADLTTAIGELDAEVSSGSTQTDTELNNVRSFVGSSGPTDAAPTYTSNIRGTASEDLESRASVLTDVVGDYQEDRSTYLRSDGELTWTGTEITFSTDIVLEILNTKTGTATAHTIAAASSPISLTNNESAWISIDRTTSGAVTVNKSGTTAIPAQTQANKDVFVLFKRIDNASTAQQELYSPFLKTLVQQGQVVRLGAAGGGSGSGGGLDVYYTDNFESVGVSNYSTGNNATFLGAGTLAGTLADETVTPISGDTSLSYTQAAGSLNDWFASEIIELDNKQQNNDSGMTFYFQYDGNVNDGKFVVYDVTNGAELTSGVELVEPSTKSTRYSLSFYVPATCDEVRWGYQVLVENTGAVLEIDDVEITSNPFVYKDLDNARQYTQDEVTVTSNAGSPTINRAVFFPYKTSDGTWRLAFNIEATHSGTTNHILSIDGVTFKNGYSQGCAVATDIASGGTRCQALSNTGDVATTSGSSITVTRPSGDVELEGKPTWADDYTTEHVITPAKSSRKVVRGAGNAGQSITANVTDIPFIEVEDELGLWDGDSFTAPEDGDYLTVGGVFFSAGVSTVIDAYVNGIETAQASLGANSTSHTFTSLLKLSKGDVLTFRSSTAGTLSNDTVNHHIHIQQISDEASLLAAIPTPKTAYIKDVKPSGTAGGTFTAGAWQTRDLNTLEGDTGFVSLSGNQVTLAPGKYKIKARTPAVLVDLHKCKLRNITDSTDAIIGDSTSASSGNSVRNTSELKGSITITSSKTFEVQHRCSTSKSSDGFGTAVTFGVDEVYTILEIEKIG